MNSDLICQGKMPCSLQSKTLGLIVISHLCFTDLHKFPWTPSISLSLVRLFLGFSLTILLGVGTRLTSDVHPGSLLILRCKYMLCLTWNFTWIGIDCGTSNRGFVVCCPTNQLATHADTVHMSFLVDEELRYSSTPHNMSPWWWEFIGWEFFWH